MIINAHVRNTFIDCGKHVVSFDGAQVTVYDQDQNELSYVSMVSGYMLSAEQIARLKRGIKP